MHKQHGTQVNIVFVCTANICRSAMSEAILKKLLQERQMQKKFTIASAGTDAMEGIESNRFSQEVCKEKGIDLSKHRSRQLTKAMLENAALVICLAENHRDIIHRAYPAFRTKVVLLKEFGRDQPPESLSVVDPIGVPKKEFAACFREIETEIKRILPFLERRAVE